MAGTLSSGIGPAGWLALAVLAAAPAWVRATDSAGPVIDTPGVSMRSEVFEVEQVLDGAGRVERRLVPAVDLVAGDELRYAIVLRNDTDARIEAGRIQVQTGVPAGTDFLPGSAGGAGALVEYSVVDGSFSTNLPELRSVASPPSSADLVEQPRADASPEAAPSVPGAAQPVGEAASSVAGVAQSVADAAQSVADAAEPPAPEGSLQDTDDPGAATRPATPAADEEAAALADGPAAGEGPGADAQFLTIRWTYQQPLEPGAEAQMFFHVRLE